jgi:hypothetical protein
MSQAPWWGIPLVAGLFAVGGVAVSQVVTIVLDRKKHRREIAKENRENARRWFTDRRYVYAAFIGSMHRSLEYASANWKSGDVASKGEPSGWDPLWHEVMNNAEEVMLIGSFKAAYRANELRLAIVELAERRRNGEDRDTVLDLIDRQLVEFAMTVRDELGANDDG